MGTVKQKAWWQKFRIPLPNQRDKFQSTQKGKKGYKRTNNKKILRKEILDEERYN